MTKNSLKSGGTFLAHRSRGIWLVIGLWLGHIIPEKKIILHVRVWNLVIHSDLNLYSGQPIFSLPF